MIRSQRRMFAQCSEKDQVGKKGLYRSGTLGAGGTKLLEGGPGKGHVQEGFVRGTPIQKGKGGPSSLNNTSYD